MEFEGIELEESNDEFAPLPEGTYLFDIVDAFKKDWDDDGSRVTVEVQLKPQDETLNGLIFDNFWLNHPSEKAKQVSGSRLKSLLESTGVKDGIITRAEDLPGFSVLARIKHEVWEGKTRAKVAKYLEKEGS